jgi:hypothetical protein
MDLNYSLVRSDCCSFGDIKNPLVDRWHRRKTFRSRFCAMSESKFSRNRLNGFKYGFEEMDTPSTGMIAAGDDGQKRHWGMNQEAKPTAIVSSTATADNTRGTPMVTARTTIAITWGVITASWAWGGSNFTGRSFFWGSCQAGMNRCLIIYRRFSRIQGRHRALLNTFSWSSRYSQIVSYWYSDMAIAKFGCFDQDGG